jgi:hypothetical protein
MENSNEYFNDESRLMMNRSIGFRERRYIEELRIVTKSTGLTASSTTGTTALFMLFSTIRWDLQ